MTKTFNSRRMMDPAAGHDPDPAERPVGRPPRRVPEEPVKESEPIEEQPEEQPEKPRIRAELAAGGVVRVHADLTQKPRGDNFYFSSAWQNLLIACLLKHRAEFEALIPMIKPSYFWGLDALRVFAAIQDYHEEHGTYPDFITIDAVIEETFGRKCADVAAETRLYLAENIMPLDTSEWPAVKKQVGDFCRERAVICAIQAAAEMVKAGEIPDAGFTQMFEKAMSAGQSVDLSEVQDGLAIYHDEPINTTVLGVRWGCRGELVLFVGPAGVGKSSSSMQMDACWAVGREAFGIKPSGALKILCIQAEDDKGDLHEMMKGVVDGLTFADGKKFTDEDKKMLASNLHYVRHNRTNGEAFLAKVVPQYLAMYKPDLLRLNPLHAYLGGDPSDPKVVSPFLRTQLMTLLQKYGCLGLINHHTSKIINRDTRNWRTLDWSYASAGSAELTNAPRAILAIDPTAAPHVFRFIAAKRGNRIGWKDEKGKTEAIRYFCQSREEGKILWTPATPEDMEEVAQAQEAQKEAKRAKRGKLYADEVLLKPLLKPGVILSLPQLFGQVHDGGCPISESQFFARAQEYVNRGILVEVSKGAFELNIEAYARLSGTLVKQAGVAPPKPVEDP
jgi:hypothetical protein